MNNKKMSWQDIKNEYKNSCVGLNNVLKDDNGNIISAVVVCSTRTMTYSDLMNEIFEHNLEYENLSDEIIL